MSFAGMFRRKKAANNPVPQKSVAGERGPNAIKLDPEAIFAHQFNPYAFLYPDNPANHLKPVSGSRFEVEIYNYTAADALKSRLNGILKGNNLAEVFCAYPGKMAALVDKGTKHTIMINGISEMRTNAEFICRARGRVLVVGLGVGMVPLALQRKAKVESIAVVEKFKEVIDLVAPQLPLSPKVQIIEGDAFTWQPEPGDQYDTVWVDIWSAINPIVYLELKQLREKYSQYLTPGGWLGAWQEGAALVDYYRSSVK